MVDDRSVGLAAGNSDADDTAARRQHDFYNTAAGRQTHMNDVVTVTKTPLGHPTTAVKKQVRFNFDRDAAASAAKRQSDLGNEERSQTIEKAFEIPQVRTVEKVVEIPEVQTCVDEGASHAWHLATGARSPSSWSGSGASGNPPTAEERGVASIKTPRFQSAAGGQPRRLPRSWRGLECRRITRAPPDGIVAVSAHLMPFGHPHHTNLDQAGLVTASCSDNQFVPADERDVTASDHFQGDVDMQALNDGKSLRVGHNPLDSSRQYRRRIPDADGGGIDTYSEL